MRRKTRPNFGNVIMLSLAFGAVAGVTKCTSWAFYEETQADRVYLISAIDPHTEIDDHGVIYGVAPSTDLTDKWGSETELGGQGFLFKLQDYPPSAIREGMCFRPVTSGNGYPNLLDLEQLNLAPCPE